MMEGQQIATLTAKMEQMQAVVNAVVVMKNEIDKDVSPSPIYYLPSEYEDNVLPALAKLNGETK